MISISRKLIPISLTSCRPKSTRAFKLMDEIYNEVRAQRFRDIVVIETKLKSPIYIILANSFNSRHLIRGTEQVNRYYKNAAKTEDEEFAKLSISANWNVLDFETVVVHLFSKECRKYYDIDQLWAVGSQFDDLTNGISSQVKKEEDGEDAVEQ